MASELALAQAAEHLFGDNLPSGAEMHIRRLAILLDSGIAHFRRRDDFPQRAPVDTLWTRPGRGAARENYQGPSDEEVAALEETQLVTKHGPHGTGQYVLWLTDTGRQLRDSESRSVTTTSGRVPDDGDSRATVAADSCPHGARPGACPVLGCANQ